MAMKLIEAMNELKLTQKKLATKIDFIRKYCARPDYKEDPFGGDEKKKIGEAVQSAIDLIQHHEDLKRAIDFTNLTTSVDVMIGGKAVKMSLHSLILHKREICALKRSVWRALDDTQAHREVEALRHRQSGDEKLKVQVVYNYDIMHREEMLSAIDELELTIDSALQIADAKLEVQEPPPVK